MDRKSVWTFKRLAILAIALVFAWLQPISCSGVAQIPRLGLSAPWPAKERIKRKLEAIGLRDAMTRLANDLKPDHSNANTAFVGIADFRRPMEDAEARMALPDSRTIPGLTSSPGWKSDGSFPLHSDFLSWTRSHGDIYNSKFSALTEINAGNADQLELAWVADTSIGANVENVQRDSGHIDRPSDNVEANPIYADGKLFISTPEWQIVALDARTGDVVWRYGDGLSPAGYRGMVYWEGDEKHPARIYVPYGSGVIALNARDGALVQEFGDGGYVQTEETRIAPILFEDELIVVTHANSRIRGYDSLTGKPRWTVNLHPSSINFYAGSPWGGAALDPDRKLLFTTTGNPRLADYGVDRPGDNANSSSLIAVDLKSKKIAWTFQETRHDLWDYDVPSAPNLTTIEIDGQKIDVVVAVSKIGNTLILERATGRPIFDFKLSRAPASTVPGEITAPYQPDPSLPEPFIDIAFSEADITDIDPESRKAVSFRVENAIYGRYQPPAFGESMITFGLHGGAQWMGAAIDHRKGVAYVPSMRVPTLIRLYLWSSGRIPPPERPSADLYKSACESCHGENRNGAYESQGEGSTTYVPSLNAISWRRGVQKYFKSDYFRHRHQFSAPNLEISDDELAAMLTFFADWDAEIQKKEKFSVNYEWTQLLDPHGRPGNKPPWGTITAIDLASGKHLWQVPFGAAMIDGRMQTVGVGISSIHNS